MHGTCRLTCGNFPIATLKLRFGAKRIAAMAYFEVRSGLRKLEFDHWPASEHDAVSATVEFVHETLLPPKQPARVTLGRHNGVVRELVGIPELIKVNQAKPTEYLYRLHGAITVAHD